MKYWTVRDAKARLSELLKRCSTEGPQLITKRGVEVAVLVSADQWRLQQENRPTLKQLLLCDWARAETRNPARRQARKRKPQTLR